MCHMWAFSIKIQTFVQFYNCVHRWYKTYQNTEERQGWKVNTFSQSRKFRSAKIIWRSHLSPITKNGLGEGVKNYSFLATFKHKTLSLVIFIFQLMRKSTFPVHLDDVDASPPNLFDHDSSHAFFLCVKKSGKW